MNEEKFSEKYILKANVDCAFLDEPAASLYREALTEIQRLQKRVRELEGEKNQLEKSSIWDKLPKMHRPDVPQEVKE